MKLSAQWTRWLRSEKSTPKWQKVYKERILMLDLQKSECSTRSLEKYEKWNKNKTTGSTKRQPNPVARMLLSFGGQKCKKDLSRTSCRNSTAYTSGYNNAIFTHPAAVLEIILNLPLQWTDVSTTYKIYHSENIKLGIQFGETWFLYNTCTNCQKTYQSATPLSSERSVIWLKVTSKEA